MRNIITAALLAVISSGAIGATELKDIAPGDVVKVSLEAGLPVPPAVLSAKAAAHDYVGNVTFPNGSQIWDAKECAAAYKDIAYRGCYSTPEILITVHEQDKPSTKVTGVIISKISENEQDNDSGGYGYCLKSRHHFKIAHEVRIIEKGKVVAHLYPEFYASAFTPNKPQNLYEWGGGMWGSSACDKTDKALSFVSADAYVVNSPEKVLDFGNIGYTLNVGQVQFTKIKP